MAAKKFISWNVNGIRACSNKGFREAFDRLDADAFCLQETKVQAGQFDIDLPGYCQYWNYAERKGYSARPFLQRTSRLRSLTDSVCPSTTPRDA